MTHSRIRIQTETFNIARLLPTSSPKRFVANERDEIRNETKLFLGNAPAFIFLLSFTIPPRKERAERERERERERETIFGSEDGVIIAQTHRTRREFMDLVITSSPKFSFLSLSLSLSLCIQKELSRGHRDTKKNSLPLSFSSGSDGFFKSYFDLSLENVGVMYCHHRHLRGLAGSRACFPRPKNAHSARAISFFLYLFHGKCLAQLGFVC